MQLQRVPGPLFVQLSAQYTISTYTYLQTFSLASEFALLVCMCCQLGPALGRPDERMGEVLVRLKWLTFWPKGWLKFGGGGGDVGDDGRSHARI